MSDLAGNGADAPVGEGTAPGGRDAWRVQLAQFEGPLDLLLHLVRINEVDITNLPIVTIAEQYQGYLDMMRELDLDIAGEYLVMAATLVHIKSRLLLPPDPAAAGEDAGEDPRADLTRQLLEFQRYKQAAENLQAIDSVRSLIWTRDGNVPAEFAGEELLADELFDMVAALKKLLDRLGEEARLRFKRDDVSVADKIGWLTDLLSEGVSIDLIEMFAGLPNRTERIATFLAVLEMARLQMIVLFQRARESEIRIALRKDYGEETAAEGGGAEERRPEGETP